MQNLALPFVLALLMSLALVPACRWAAIRLGCVAKPREDRWHKRPIALFGGVAIGVTLLAGVIGFGAGRDLVVLLSCASLIFIVGLIDDVISLKPSTKLIVEIALASVLLFFGYRLNWVNSITLDALLTLVWIVGVTNAFNLLDNMDGLCGGIAVIVGTALLLDLVPGGPAGVSTGEILYLTVLLGAVAGFLFYNVHPAKIFMGDSGSLLLGFSFAALTLNSGHEAASRSNVLSVVAIPVFVLLIPIFDTTLVTVMRKLSGRSASVGGRDHSSHRLVAMGLSERAAVGVLWLLAAIGGGIAVAMRYRSLEWTGLAAAVFLLSMIIFAVYLARIRVYEDTPVSEVRAQQLTPIVAEMMYKRRVAEVLLDFCLVAIAYYAAYRLRFEGPYEFLDEFRNFSTSLPLVLGVQLVAFFIVGVYRGVWRYFGLMDAVTMVKGVALGAMASQLIILYMSRFFSYSRAVFVIYSVLLVGLMTLSRASFRLFGEFAQRQRSAGRRVVVYGAGDSAMLAVRELQAVRDESVKILGFVDDDPQVARMRVQGYPVLGDFAALELLVSTGSVDWVIVAGGHLSAERLSVLQLLCEEHGCSLSRLHIGIEEIVSTDTAQPPSTKKTPHLRRVGS